MVSLLVQGELLLMLLLVLKLFLSLASVNAEGNYRNNLFNNSTCPEDKILNGYSLFKGSIIVKQLNLTSQADCCSLCHSDFHDECVAWEWIDQYIVHSPTHNCDIMAKVGPPQKYPGRVSGLISNSTPKPAPAPSGSHSPCNSDSNCEALWNTPNWRCLEDRFAIPTSLNNCHMHAETQNSTCACLPSAGCGGGAVKHAVVTHPNMDASTNTNTTQALLMIGDSISMGMKADLAQLLQPNGWSLWHNPGNGDNTNYGAHCVPTWLTAEGTPYDIISFQFGLHDIAYDEERLTLAQYTMLLTNITQYLITQQREYGTKLLWVKTTPVPTVPTYGFDCNGSGTDCLNPARFDHDVVRFNTAADTVIAAAVAKGANISISDLYTFVLNKCGGHGYSTCPGFQLPNNVHFTNDGWKELAEQMHRDLLALYLGI